MREEGGRTERRRRRRRPLVCLVNSEKAAGRSYSDREEEGKWK